MFISTNSYPLKGPPHNLPHQNPSLSVKIRHYPSKSVIICHYPSLSVIVVRHYPSKSAIIRQNLSLSVRRILTGQVVGGTSSMWHFSTYPGHVLFKNGAGQVIYNVTRKDASVKKRPRPQGFTYTFTSHFFGIFKRDLKTYFLLR